MCLEITVCVMLGYQERIVLVADPLSSYEGLLTKLSWLFIVYMRNWISQSQKTL